MKKTLLLLILLVSAAVTAQVEIYNTTHAGTNGAEITGTANGPATSFGDAVKLAGTERFLKNISVDLFNLTDTSDFTVTMTLFSDCPTTAGAGVCGSGIGTLIPFSENIVLVETPATTGKFTVDFEYNDLDISSETDNTITVMLNCSRNNVFWVINETPVIGSTPTGDTALSTVTRCGSTVANNGCARVFASPIVNNVAMKILAGPGLKTNEFTSAAFTVFPNPIADVIHVSNDKNISFNAMSLTDVNGRTVKSKTFENTSNADMNVADLAAGIYLLKITADQGAITKKIIKN